MTKVGVIGSGDVGQALGRGFASRGYKVKIGSRTPNSEKLKVWMEKCEGEVSVGTFSEVAAHGEILVLATLGTGVEEAINLSGRDKFARKLVIDATNPLDFSRGMPPGLFVGTTDSLGERVQRMLPSAKVVKCFNIVNYQTMVNPKKSEGLPDMLICGNDEDAKRRVAEILREFGWGEPIDIGGIDGARWLEAYTALWVRLAVKLGNWTIAAKFLKS
jgi:predicted dinucleotide-binding enzyme